MSTNQKDDGTYHTVRKEALPKWIKTETYGGASDAPPRAATRPHVGDQKADSFNHWGAASWQKSSLSDDDDWELISNTSDSEDNGTKQARKKHEHIARRERENSFVRDQKANMADQIAISKRIAQQQKEAEERRARRKEWYDNAGSENKAGGTEGGGSAGWLGWLGKGSSK